MKKIISLILSCVMLLALMVPSVTAADTASAVLTITDEQGNTLDPDEAGVYTVTVEDKFYVTLSLKDIAATYYGLSFGLLSEETYVASDWTASEWALTYDTDMINLDATGKSGLFFAKKEVDYNGKIATIPFEAKKMTTENTSIEIFVSLMTPGSENLSVSVPVKVLGKDFPETTLLLDNADITGDTITYDGNAHTVTVSNKPEGSTVKFNGTEADSISFIAVGTYPVTATIEQDGYNTMTLNTTVTIAQKSLTVNGVDVEDKVYDGDTDAALVEGTVEGIVAGDNVTVKYAPVAFGEADVDTYSIDVGLSLEGEDAKNYTIADKVTVEAAITPLEVTVTPVVATKVYDENDLSDPVFNYTWDNDTLVTEADFTGKLSRTDVDKTAVGTYYITQGDLKISKNFTIKFVDNVEYNIIARQYARLEISGDYEKAYIADQTFDPTGMIIKGYYYDTDGETEVATPDDIPVSSCAFTPKPLTAGTTKVTVTFGDVKTEIDVTVAEKVLEGIVVEGAKNEFLEGDAFTYEGLKVYGDYDNDIAYINYPIAAGEGGYSVTVPTTAYRAEGELAKGSHTITVTYADKTATYTITVAARELDKLVLEGKAVTDTYIEGQTFNPGTIKAYAVYNNNDKVEVDASYAPTGALALGNEITYSYTENGKTVTAVYDITVLKKDITAIVVDSTNTKKEYTERTPFEPAGTVVTLTYNDNTTETADTVEEYAAYGIKFAPAIIQSNTTAVTVSIATIGNGTLSQTIPVTVKARSVTKLEVTPAAEYVDGTAIGADNTTVKATFDNGETDANFTGYTVDPAALKLTDAKVGETITVTVSYTNAGETTPVTTTFDAKVVPCEAVNTTTGERYASLEDALTEAEDGETVAVQFDTEITEDVEISADVTFALNGKNVTTAEGFTINTGANILTVDNSNGTADVVLSINGEEVTIAAGEIIDVTEAEEDTISDEEDTISDFEIMFSMARTYHENFVFDITIEKAAHGTIKGRTLVRIGETPTFTITPDEGYEIVDVIVDGESVGAVEKYKFDKVKDDHTITAVFEKID